MDPSEEAEAKMDAAKDHNIKSDGEVNEGKGEESGIKIHSTKVKDDDKLNITESCNKMDTAEQNVSSSWVFVDVKSNAGKSDNARKFYLNCSEEPVQELHQHELSAHNSGSDSDTDGISVISESDPSKTDEEGVLHPRIFKEQFEDVEFESETAVRREETHDITEVSQIIRSSSGAQKSALTFNQLSYLAAFSILILLIPLQWYFQLYDFERKQVETTGKVSNIPSEIEIDSPKTDYINSDRLVIDDPFAYCTKIHENSDYMYKSRNVKKCMKKLERAKEKLNRVHQKLQDAIPESDEHSGHEDIEEIHLNYKAEYSKLNNNENKHEVYSKKVKYRKPHESKGRKKYEKEYRIIRNTTNKEAKAYKFEYYSDNDKNNSTLNKSEVDSQQRPKIKEEEISSKYSDYENKLKAKEKYLREKEQYLHLKEKELKEREMRSHQATEYTVRLDGKNDKVQNESSNNYNDSKVKKKFYRHEPTEKLDDAGKRHGKKKATKYTADVLPNDDSASEYRAKHSHHNNIHEKDHTKQKDRQSGESSNDKNGDWYNNLFEERSKLRKRNKGDDRNNENNKMKRKSHRNRYKSEEDDNTQNGHWYSKLFEGRAKLRRNTDKYFMKDDDLMTEYKMYSNRYRTDSFSL